MTQGKGKTGDQVWRRAKPGSDEERVFSRPRGDAHYGSGATPQNSTSDSRGPALTKAPSPGLPTPRPAPSNPTPTCCLNGLWSVIVIAGAVLLGAVVAAALAALTDYIFARVGGPAGALSRIGGFGFLFGGIVGLLCAPDEELVPCFAFAFALLALGSYYLTSFFNPILFGAGIGLIAGLVRVLDCHL